MRSATFPRPAPTTNSKPSATSAALPTFLEHVYELRRRLFWVVGTVLVLAMVSFAFIDNLYAVLTQPLGNEQLYYLTPIGGLTFMFKLCAYVGLTLAVPVLMYNIYKYLEPLMGNWRRSAFFYVGLSSLFAAGGIAFAYFVSLPAALHFLTGFDIGGIEAMLTVDAYLSFVMVYLFGAALLFQIPLLLLITNTMTPLQPKKLLSFMKFVVVGAFILAAIISPTPDIMNQSILAVPIIIMYLLGVGLVAIQNHSRQKKSKATASNELIDIPDYVLNDFTSAKQFIKQPSLGAQHANSKVFSKPPVTAPHTKAKVYPQPAAAARSVALRPALAARATPATRRKTISVPMRSIDGFATQYRKMA